MNGIVSGGWPFVWAAYVISALVLGGYAAVTIHDAVRRYRSAGRADADIRHEMNRRTMKKLITILATCIVIAAPSAFAGGSGADGTAVYKAKCAMCHGPDGAGQTPMGKNLKVRALASADVQQQTDAELTKWITDGKGKMPAYKAKLTPADIDAVVAFIRTLKK